MKISQQIILCSRIEHGIVISPNHIAYSSISVLAVAGTKSKTNKKSVIDWNMEILEKAHHQNMTLIITGMMNTLHYTNGSRHNATKGYFIGHLNTAYSLDKLEDLQSDFMSKMLTIMIISVMCFTETNLEP